MTVFQSISGRLLGGAMDLGKLLVPGRPTIWIIVGQGLVGWLVVLGLTAL